MKVKEEQKNNASEKPPKKYKFYLGSRERYITINCDFDSGNISLVRQLSEFQYRLSSVHDGTFTGHKVNSKSWFYFCVTGFPKNTKGKFFVTKVQTLSSIYHSKYFKSYRPVFKIGDDGEWERLQTECQLVLREDGELECVFEYLFKDENERIFFAFCYPFTYTECKRYTDSLNEFIYNDDFYFHKEIFIKSIEGRNIYLITITSYDLPDKVNEFEDNFNTNMFPEKSRPQRFMKPVVLISARVHPGESSSSFAMKGVIDFLTNKDDLRAKLLRKMFVFMIVPMINVDGVYHGHFRMDTEGKNLNRFYIKPNLEKHPAVYAIKELAEYLNKENRLSFYFDLHAHNAKKGHFIYGNAINDFVEQVESQVFCKLISLNNKGFEYQYCNFSEKHMNAKDRNEDLTKEGCGRVVMHRLAKIIHSYSVECGIVSPNKENVLPDPLNINFKLENKGFIVDKAEDNGDEMFKSKGEDNALFTPKMYENLGKNLMVSILDVFDKNPYNRVYNSKYKSMDMLRRMTAFEIFHEAERFRMFERFIFGKVKNINELIREVLNTKLHYKKLYNFYFYDDKELKNVIWPENVPGLCKPEIKISNKIRKHKADSQANDYSESFMKALMTVDEKEKIVTQEELEQEGEENNSKSSETEVYEVDQNLEEDFPEMISSYQTVEKYPINENFLQPILTQKTKQTFPHIEIESPHKREVSLSPPKDVLIPENTQTEISPEKEESVHLYVAMTKNQPCSSATQKRKENPSVRVRRLLRQDIGVVSFKSDREITELKKRSEEKEFQSATEIKNNIYESIKREIKEELMRESRERRKITKFESQTSGVIKPFSPVRVTKERIKSWTMKKNQSDATSRGKIELPSLGAQMYIVAANAHGNGNFNAINLNLNGARVKRG